LLKNLQNMTGDYLFAAPCTFTHSNQRKLELKIEKQSS